MQAQDSVDSASTTTTAARAAAADDHRVADRHRPGRRWRFDVYLLLASGVLVWAVGVAVQHTWTADFLLHVGTVKAFARDLLNPPDPMVGAGSGSPYYSPLIMLVAVLVRLTGLSPTAVFAGVAVANTVLLLWAFRRFVAWFTTSSLAAAAALLATLFLWGVRPPMWSGFLSLRSLAETLPYPSTTAFALMLLAWDRLLRYRVRRDTASLVAFGSLAAAITLIHSFTAVNTAIGGLALLAAYATGWRRADLLKITLAGVGALALVLAWPYSSIWDLATSAPEFAQIHRLLWDNLLDPRELSCGYAIVALVPLLLRLRRDRRDPLVIMFGLAVAVIAFGAASGQYHLLRVIPVAMLPLHVAFGAFVADADLARLAWRRLVAVTAAVVVLAGLVVDVAPLSGFVGAVPLQWIPGPLQSMTRTASLTGPSSRYDFVRDYAPEGSTVFTDHRTADRHLNRLGYFTVNPGWPNPWIGDEPERARDRATLLRAETDPATRGAIADRYDADCVLITRTAAVTGPEAISGYQRVRTGPGSALYCR
ncbi:MAG TPA: hypothetical protein VF174_15590 [Micromonosporaceae bacterium]